MKKIFILIRSVEVEQQRYSSNWNWLIGTFDGGIYTRSMRIDWRNPPKVQTKSAINNYHAQMRDTTSQNEMRAPIYFWRKIVKNIYSANKTIEKI